MTGVSSFLYEGRVVHQRVRPRRHRLGYRVFTLLLDLDELPALQARLRLFAYNRMGIVGFADRDHGDATGKPLRTWVEEQLRRAGIDLAGGAIRLLCYPRILGYVFNPLSVYYCHYGDGRLAALLYEVNNTFGERHSYLIPAGDAGGATIHQECDKLFYVSPFIAVDGRYRFRVTPPGPDLSIAITQVDADGPLLHAVFSGQRKPLEDRTLASALLRYPLLTLKVMGGIHWEALRLWIKGVPLIRRPSPPAEPVTIVSRRVSCDA
jgi:uncharacterized protein